MHCSVKVTIFVFTMVHTMGLQNEQEMCPTINVQHCFPPKETETCIIRSVQNGTGLTWFDMEKNCTTHDGRLVFMREKFEENHLLTTVDKSYNAQILAIGMMMSFEGDNKTFWTNPRENDTFSCGSKDTKVCLSSAATPENCNLIGCCWVNGKCQYPEHQWLAETNVSTGINTSAVATTTERVCVGLEVKSRKLKAYNCSLPAASGTGFVCEYKCVAEWPDLPRQNISFTRTASTNNNMLETTSSKKGLMSTTSKPIEVNKTDAENKRNNSASAFKRKMSLMVYFGLLSLMFQMLTL